MAKGEAWNCFRLDSGLTCVGQQLNNMEQCRIKTKAREINSPTTPSFAGRINPNHSTVPPSVIFISSGADSHALFVLCKFYWYVGGRR